MPKPGPVYRRNLNSPERFHQFINHPDVIKKLEECGIIAVKIPSLTKLSQKAKILESTRFKAMLSTVTDVAVYTHEIYSQCLLGMDQVTKKDELTKERARLGDGFSSYTDYCDFSDKIQEERDQNAKAIVAWHEIAHSTSRNRPSMKGQPFILTPAAAQYGYDKLPPKEKKFWAQLFHKASIKNRRSYYGISFDNLMLHVDKMYNLDHLPHCLLREMLARLRIPSISGCTDFLTYWATEQSISAIHVEDADMTSINFQISDNNEDDDSDDEEMDSESGDDDDDFVLEDLLIKEEMSENERPGKVWYGMPASEHSRVRELISGEYKRARPKDKVADTDPEYFAGARNKFAFPDVGWLEENGIKVFRIVQKPSYAVLTAPKAAHQVINLNSSVNVASNYGTQHWADKYLFKGPTSDEGISEGYKELFHRLSNLTLRPAVTDDVFFDIKEDEKQLCVELREKVVANGVDFEMNLLSSTELIRAPHFGFCEETVEKIQNSCIVSETVIWIYVGDANGEREWSVLEAGLKSRKYHAKLISGSQRVYMYFDLMKKATYKATVFANCTELEVVKLIGHSILAERHTAHPRELTWLLRLFRECQRIHFAEKREELGICGEFPLKNLLLNQPHHVKTQEMGTYGIVPIQQMLRDDGTILKKLKIALPEFLEPMDDALERTLRELGDFMNFPVDSEPSFYKLCQDIETGKIDLSRFRMTSRNSGKGIFNCRFSLSVLKDLSQSIEGLPEADVRSARLRICVDESINTEVSSSGINLARQPVPDHPLIKALMEKNGLKIPGPVFKRPKIKANHYQYLRDELEGKRTWPKDLRDPTPPPAKKPKRSHHKKASESDPEIQIIGVKQVIMEKKVSTERLKAASSAVNTTMADLLMGSFKTSVHHKFFIGEGERNKLMLCQVVKSAATNVSPYLVHAISYGQFLLNTTEYTATTTFVKFNVGDVPSLNSKFVKKHASGILTLCSGIHVQLTTLVRDSFSHKTLEKFCG